MTIQLNWQRLKVRISVSAPQSQGSYFSTFFHSACFIDSFWNQTKLAAVASTQDYQKGS
jgi:hypothetical protein